MGNSGKIDTTKTVDSEVGDTVFGPIFLTRDAIRVVFGSRATYRSHMAHDDQSDI